MNDPLPQHTLLATVTGRDRPGVSAALFDVLSGRVLDIEQVVVAGRLIQVMLIALGPEDEAEAITAGLEQVAARLDLQVDVEPGGAQLWDRRAARHLVTVLAEPLRPRAIAGISPASL